MRLHTIHAVILKCKENHHFIASQHPCCSDKITSSLLNHPNDRRLAAGIQVLSLNPEQTLVSPIRRVKWWKQTPRPRTKLSGSSQIQWKHIWQSFPPPHPQVDARSWLWNRWFVGNLSKNPPDRETRFHVLCRHRTWSVILGSFLCMVDIPLFNQAFRVSSLDASDPIHLNEIPCLIHTPCLHGTELPEDWFDKEKKMEKENFKLLRSTCPFYFLQFIKCCS